MVIFSLILIGAFTAIQVHNQVTIITGQNRYQSKLSSIIIRKSIDQLVSEIKPEAQGAIPVVGDIHKNIGQLMTDVGISAPAKKEDWTDSLKKTIRTLINTNMAAAIFVVNNKGEIIAQGSAGDKPLLPSPQELERIQNIIDLNAQDQPMYSFLNREDNSIDVLMPIVINGKVQYVLQAAHSLGNLQDALRSVYIPILFTIGTVILLSLFSTLSLSRKIINPIKTLNEASKQIAGGDLALQVQVKTNDEIEDLAWTFNDMTRQLARMKEIAENANPLTKLPGNYVIHEEIDKRIKAGKKFIVIHSDLDNFKVYNDAYGIGAGDEAIYLTANLFKEAIQKFGGAEDFIGHEGGDDFVFLTTPQTVKPITDYFLAEFDKRSKLLYTPEDREKGYIVGKERRFKTRDGEEEKAPHETKTFPLMSISFAGLSNAERPFDSYAAITNRMVEVKKAAKRTSGSCLVLVNY
jgi:GGDEF domain-containing protein